MRAPRWLGAAVAAAAIVGACTDAGTSPNAVVAIAFDTLPYPAVVASDTMRDSLGKAAPFHAIAYNSNGAAIVSPNIRYLALDTGVLIDAQGYFVANTRTSGSVRVVATASGLQSVTKTVQVTRAPSKLAITTKASDTLKYALPDVASTNVMPLTVKLTGDSSGVALPVTGFLVSWQVTYRGAVIPKSDTTIVSLFDDVNHASLLDTTSTDGSAGRKLRVRSNNLPSAADSFVVFATAKYRGAVVAGSPAKFVIHFRPKSAR
jgi:hypothetical protein